MLRTDIDMLRRVVKVHEMFVRGMEKIDIAEQLHMSWDTVGHYLKMVKPKIPDYPATDWMKDSACEEKDLPLFFPEKQGTLSAQAKAKAKRICASCPVKAQCLRMAQDNFERFGIWGGEDFSRRSYDYNPKTGVITVGDKYGAHKKVS